jgi:hypothetical protein
MSAVASPASTETMKITKLKEQIGAIVTGAISPRQSMPPPGSSSTTPWSKT